MPKVFISHSSADANIAEALAFLFKDALGLKSEDIYATSADAFALAGGVRVEETLRLAARDADVFIALMTPSILKSTYAAFELGARWASGRPLTPLISNTLDKQRVPAPLSSYNYIAITESHMQTLLSDISVQLRLRLARYPIYKARLQALQRLVDASQPQAIKLPFFGYFFFETEGLETILVEIQNDQWRFPIFGQCEPSESVEKAINDSISRFIRTATPIQTSFLNSTFYQPDIIKIQERPSQGCHPHLIDHAYFVKIRVDRQFDLHAERDSLSYCWVKKIPFFTKARAYNKPLSIDPRYARFLRLIHQDKILSEVGYSVLECVDIIVFRQTPSGDHEFLLLHRRDAPSPETRWEYPKGGIAYHETLREGALRELLEETGVETMADFRFGDHLGIQTPEVHRPGKPYNCLRVHGLTFDFLGEPERILEHVGSDISKEHDNAQWLPFSEARDKVWMVDFPKVFFDRWLERLPRIDTSIARPTSVAFEVSEKCSHTCRYCHRRVSREPSLSRQDIESIIDSLADRRVKRLTFTGGEPLLCGKDNIFYLIKYANLRHIHTCLSTTGLSNVPWRLTNSTANDIQQNDIFYLERYLDHLLISVNCIRQDSAQKTYARIDDWQVLLCKADEMLRWTRHSDIIVEVVTVITRHNLDESLEMLAWCLERNDRIFLRVDEYYPNGIGERHRDDFVLAPGEFSELRSKIVASRPLSDLWTNKRINFNTADSRLTAPDVMISPQGNLVSTSDNRYNVKARRDALPYWKFQNRRPYTEYKRYFRKWPWTTIEEINGREWIKRHQELAC